MGPSRAQAIPENFTWPELVTVTDLASAQEAIDTILEQGEGARGEWEHAHFGQFVQILDEYREMLAANPAFEPVRPVMFATVRRCEHDETVPQIGERVTPGSATCSTSATKSCCRSSSATSRTRRRPTNSSAPWPRQRSR